MIFTQNIKRALDNGLTVKGARYLRWLLLAVCLALLAEDLPFYVHARRAERKWRGLVRGGPLLFVVCGRRTGKHAYRRGGFKFRALNIFRLI